MVRLYNIALAPLRLALAVWSRVPRGPAGAREWAERSGRLTPHVERGAAWIHGASVGEVRIVSSLAAELRRRSPALPIAVSAVTPTGRAQLPSPPAVDAAFYAPLDVPIAAARVLGALAPSVLTLVETELWPNLITQAARAGVPVALVNARLSPERMSRYRWLGRLYRPLLATLSAVGAQHESEAERLIELGVRPEVLRVTGNIKYDLPVPDVDSAALRRDLELPPDRPVVVAGSTRPGEEAQVLEAFASVRRAHPSALLVLAPRHVERADEVARLGGGRGLRLVRLSGAEKAGAADVLLVDVLGRLAALYSIAGAAFIGGTLVPAGGHNVLEPAAAGVPVLFGPHTGHVEEPARALLEARGACRVSGPAELAHAWTELISNAALRATMGASARSVLEANRGAIGRTADLVLALASPRASVAAGGRP